MRCFDAHVITKGRNAFIELKNSGVVRRAGFRFSHDDRYIKFYNGWAKFVTKTGIDLNDPHHRPGQGDAVIYQADCAGSPRPTQRQRQ